MCDAALIDDMMGWGPGPGGIEEGTPGADLAATALISTVLTLDGAGAAKAGELGAPLLWGGEREREGGNER